MEHKQCFFKLSAILFNLKSAQLGKEQQEVSWTYGVFFPFF